MSDETPLKIARTAAAKYFRNHGYAMDAMFVEAGRGDDLREVEIALALWKIMHVAQTPATRYKGWRLVAEEC